MHGIIKPQHDQLSEPTHWTENLRAWSKRNRWFLLTVIMPTFLTAVYYYLIAADQYQSEAHFVMRTGDASPIPTSGIGQLFGLSSGVSQARSEAMSVNDYLHSSQAAEAVDHSIGLVDRFRRPEADYFTRLWSADPTPERLLAYYRKHVDIKMDDESGITAIQVRSFRPGDSYTIISKMLELGEQRVNLLNRRSQTDTVSYAQQQLDNAATALSNIQVQMTRFRQQRGDLDPEGSGKAQISLAASLQGMLAQARAQLNSMHGIIAPNSPQYVATAHRVQALQAQVAAQSGSMTNGGGAIATKIGGYQELEVREEFAAKRYEAAATLLEKARSDATKQQLYLVRVVDPNMPVKSEFPERGKVLLTVFLSLLLAYGIGWLLVAGVKEHSL